MNPRLVPILAGLLTLAMVVALSGCDDDDDPGKPVTSEARIRVQHLFPAAGPVDVYATPQGAKSTAAEGDPILVFQGVDYLESSDFAEVRAGSYQFDVTLAGESIEDAVLTVPDVELTRNTAYTALAWDDGSGLAALLLVDDLSNPGAGNLRIRAIHAASAVGEVDIWNVTDPANPGLLWEDLATGSAGAYLVVPAQAYVLGVDVDDDQLVDIFISVPSLPAGSIVNAFASLDATGDFFVLAQLQNGTTAVLTPEETSLRVVHGASGVDDVDVWADEAVLLLEDFAFTAGSSATTVPAGTYDIQLTAPNGNPSSPLVEFAGVTLLPGDLTAAAWVDGTPQLLAAVDDLSSPPAGMFRVRAIHIAGGVGQVDIWERTGPTPLWVDLDPGEVGDYLELDAGAYQIGFDLDNDQATDVDFDLPTIAAGEVLNIFAINDGGTVFLLAQFVDGTTARIDAN